MAATAAGNIKKKSPEAKLATAFPLVWGGWAKGGAGAETRGPGAGFADRACSGVPHPTQNSP